jgi:hypothetical protein
VIDGPSITLPCGSNQHSLFPLCRACLYFPSSSFLLHPSFFILLPSFFPSFYSLHPFTSSIFLTHIPHSHSSHTLSHSAYATQAPFIWDPERRGSWHGSDEFSLNFGRIKDGLSRTADTAELKNEIEAGMSRLSILLHTSTYFNLLQLTSTYDFDII